MKKKGVIEAQFNWVFVLIVGGVIFLFFLTFANNQKKTADTQISSELLDHLDSIAKGAALSIGTVYDIDLPPKQALQNVCESGRLTFYDSSLEGIDISYTPLFSPKIISGTKLYTYSEYWKAPFIVSPILYMTSDNVLFIVVNNDPLLEERSMDSFDLIPVNANDNKVDSEGNKELVLKYYEDEDFLRAMLNTNYYDSFTEVKIIFFGSFDHTIFDNLDSKKSKISIYQVESLSDDGFDDSFSAKKYSSKDLTQVEVIKGFGVPTFLAFIYSESVDDYKCGMKKVLQRYEVIINIYKDKTNSTYEYVLDKGDLFNYYCKDYYVLSLYDQLSFISNQLLISNDFNEFTNLADISEVLNNNNQNLGDYSCPLPY